MDENLRIIIIVIFSISFVLFFLWLAYYLVKNFRAELLRNYTERLDSLEKDQNVLAKFSYTQDEWNRIFQQEFNETMFEAFMKAKGTSRRKYQSVSERQARIYFFPKKIIITNGPDFKEFKFNNFNRFGFGCYLMSVSLKSKQILEMKVKIASGKPGGVSAPSFGIDISDETYRILIPASDVRGMDRIVNTYRESISAEAFYENFSG